MPDVITEEEAWRARSWPGCRPTSRTHARALASSRRRSEDRAEVFGRGDTLVVVVADVAGGMRGGATAADALVLAVSSAAADGAFDVESVAAWSSVFRETDAEFAARPPALLLQLPRAAFAA